MCAGTTQTVFAIQPIHTFVQNTHSLAAQSRLSSFGVGGRNNIAGPRINSAKRLPRRNPIRAVV
jgi:hypothetical protein